MITAFKYRVTGSYKGRTMATAYCGSMIRALAISMAYAAHGWQVNIK